MLGGQGNRNAIFASNTYGQPRFKAQPKVRCPELLSPQQFESSHVRQVIPEPIPFGGLLVEDWGIIAPEAPSEISAQAMPPDAAI